MGADGLSPAEADAPSEQPPLPDGTSEQNAAGQQPTISAPPSTASATEEKSSAEDDFLLKEFFAEMKDVDRDNEVQRILFAFKLNPFEKLNLRFTATPEEVRRQYRKISLMVHPDKCKHKDASTAFEILGQAQKELLDDERRDNLLKVLEMARDEVRQQRAKETKNDTTIELAALLHEKGKEGVQEQYEQTDDFHEKWKMKARDLLAKSEWRRRKLVKRLKDETERAKEESAEQRQNAKRQKEHEKQWESTRDTRVGTWRDFMKKGGTKGGTHIKPPKQKTWDEEKTYVQRPVGEQHRPPPPKPAGPKKS